MTEHNTCHICGAKTTEVNGYNTFNQVTSDCKPWSKLESLTICEACGTVQKPLTNKWFKDISQIYNQYEIYSQSAGQEQVIFESNNNNNKPRSQIIVEEVLKHVDNKSSLNLLDVGCGTGVFSKQFSDHFSDYNIDGFEFSDKNLPLLKQIKNFTSLKILK